VKKAVSLGITIISVGLTVLGPHQAAFASSGINFNGSNLDGGGTVTGAQATIHTPPPPSLDSSDAYANSSVWVMENNANSPGGYEYAQVGFYKTITNYTTGSSGVYYFFEDSDSNGSVVDFLTNGNLSLNGYANHSNFSGAVGPAPDSSHVYKVWHANGAWHGSVDGAFTSVFDVPDNNTGWTANVAEYETEVHDLSSSTHFYGHASDPAQFENVYYLNSSGTAQYVPSSNLHYVTTGTSTYGGHAGPYGTGSNLFFEMWDTRDS